ncbi:MAG: CPBP family intramembrane glutamic endopeptidase [Longimicrobiaceae bacterium]
MSAPGPATSAFDNSPRARRLPAGEPAPGEPAGPAKDFSRAEALALAVVVTVAAHAIPGWYIFGRLWTRDVFGVHAIPWGTFHSLLCLLFGLLLAAPTWRRSGLVLGDIRTHWRRVLPVCGGPVLVAALVYPRLPVRPFADAGIDMWLISPLAQSLVFIGYLYGRLDTAFPGLIHRRLPIRRSLAITAAFFALWHVPGFANMPAWYAAFQLFYTGVAYLVPALSRQWTGSILYVLAGHMAINFIAWAAN